MKKHPPAPEGYYEDDADEEHELDVEQASIRSRLQQRLMAVFGTSYGISVAVHLAILAILATIIITTPAEPTTARLSVSREPIIPPATERRPDIQEQREVPLPENEHVPLVSDVEEPNPTPIGDPTNVAAVELDKKSFDDSIGTAGAGAGAFGTPRGKGPARDSGGGPDTECSVYNGLKWLLDHQSPDGRWEAQGWAKRCREGTCTGPGWNEGSAEHDVGVTGLALLAYLGNGNTHRFGRTTRFKVAVRDGLRWLRAQQAADGSIGMHGGNEQIYDHAIATMVLCESYALTRDPELKGPALRATEFLIAAQNPKLGWKYGVRSGINDTSVTGWAVLALKAARVAELPVPDEAFDGAKAWFERATSEDGAAGYETPGGGSSYLKGMDATFDELPVNTSVAVLGRVLMGERRSTDELRKGGKLLLNERPSWPSPDATRKVNFYYWYYGTYAMFQLGGQAWFDWNEPMKKALLPTQRTGGCEDGSWDPVDPWSAVGGRVYATALNALTLEIYYRYARTKEEPSSQAPGGK